MFHRSIAAGAVALVVVACSDISAPLPSDPAFSLGTSLHSVVGAGHVEQNAGLREFTFHAVQRPDGSASGSYKVVLPNGLFIEADVTCLAVDGNTGWVGGVVRATNAAVVIVGSTSMFYAVDGGEGEGAIDRVSVAAFNAAAGADLTFCANRPLALPSLTVTQGNVQVQ